MVELPDLDPESILAKLKAPATVEQGEDFDVIDISELGKDTILDYANIYRIIDGGEREFLETWYGNGRKGENSGKSIPQNIKEPCNIVYEIEAFSKNGLESKGSTIVNIVEEVVSESVDGEADLILRPTVTYEGHDVKALDNSTFTVTRESKEGTETTQYSSGKAYSKGIASNSYIANGATTNKRDDYDRILTYDKAGNYDVTLKVRISGGGTLYDTESVEVLPTPNINAVLSGFQKQNRKQILDITVATHPKYPINEFNIKITDLKTRESIVLTKDTLQNNNDCIKTRILEVNTDDKYFTTYKLEFLTKYPCYKDTLKDTRDFKYEVNVKDTKDEISKVEKVFTVVPDIPPQAEILMENVFLRNEGSNVANIVTEDVTTSDGDDIKRTWYTSSYDARTGLPTGIYKNAIDNAGYSKLSFGTDQKIGYEKQGVGRESIKLFVKDVWTEDTLKEYIKEADYLTNQAIYVTDVINIAPKVSIEPLETLKANIIILLNKDEMKSLDNRKTELQASLIEEGIDANVSYIPILDESESREIEEVHIKETNKTSCISQLKKVDSEYYYTITRASQNDDSPVSLNAYDIKTNNKKWGYTVSNLQFYTATPHNLQIKRTINEKYMGEGDAVSIYCDDKEKYIYVVNNCTEETILLKRDSGTFAGRIPFVITGDPFISSDYSRIYLVNENGITKYNLINLKETIITKKPCYCAEVGYDKDGVNEGKVAFIMRDSVPNSKLISKFYYSHLDTESEEIEALEYPDLDIRDYMKTFPNDSAPKNLIEMNSIFIPIDMDSEGNALFSGVRTYVERDESVIWDSQNISAAAYIDFKNRKIEYLSGSNFTGSGYRDWDSLSIDGKIIKNEVGRASSVFFSNDIRTGKRSHWNTMKIYDLNGKNYDFDYDSVPYGRTFYDSEGNQKILLVTVSKNYLIDDKFYKETTAMFDGDKTYVNLGNSLFTYKNQRDDTWNGTTTVFDFYSKVKLYNLPTSKDALTEYALKRLAKVDNENQTYVIDLEERHSALNSVNTFISDNNAYLISKTKDKLLEIGKDIKSLGENVKSMMQIKGTNSANVAKILKDLELEPNTKYEYSYDLIQKTSNSNDLLTFEANANGVNTTRTENGMQYKKVLERIDFTSGGMPTKTYAKYTGGLYGAGTFSYNGGFGYVNHRSNSDGTYSGSRNNLEISFNLKNDGYVSWTFSQESGTSNYFLEMLVDGNIYEKYTQGTGSKDSYSKDNYADDTNMYNNKRFIKFPAGNHTINIKSGSRSDNQNYHYIIHNIEIGEFERINNSNVVSSTIKNTQNIKQEITGSFTTSNNYMFKLNQSQNLQSLTAQEAITKGYLGIDGSCQLIGNENEPDDNVYWGDGTSLMMKCYPRKRNRGGYTIDEHFRMIIKAPADKNLYVRSDSGSFFVDAGTYYRVRNTNDVWGYSNNYGTTREFGNYQYYRWSDGWSHYSDINQAELTRPIFTGLRIIEIPINNTVGYKLDDDIRFNDSKDPASIIGANYETTSGILDDFYLIRGANSATPRLEKYETDVSTKAGDYIGFITGDKNVEQYISNLVISRADSTDGIKRIVFKNKFSNNDDLDNWNITKTGNGVVEISQIAPIEKEKEEFSLTYKKGELIKYGINYSDYENDPSKANQGQSYWIYAHTPYNDGENENAAIIYDEDGNISSICGKKITDKAITIEKSIEIAKTNGLKTLNKPIDRFYVDGKYTVYHWEHDDTSRGIVNGGYPSYDKPSNIAELTFYVQGNASAPWVTGISTSPDIAKENEHFSINVGIDDAEKDILNLTTEVYKDKKHIFTHRKKNIYPIDAQGKITTDPAIAVGYPVTNTGALPDRAQAGKYEVVCTVRDDTGAGIGSYSFTVISQGKITGEVYHTEEWDKNRKKYNLSLFKNEINKVISFNDYMEIKKPRTRGTNVFWSGEKFMLQAAVAGNPTKVTCKIKGTSYIANMRNTGRKNAKEESIYEGILWDSSMINKWGREKPEVVTFMFTAIYDSGVNKTNEVKIIIDNMDEYYRLHRVF
ncbi:MAG: hypothetical protein ACK5MV_08370 [Aminipila sp.]